MKIGSNFLRLFSIMAILVLVLIIGVVSTFSWYNPTVYSSSDVPNKGNSLRYNIEGKINRISGCDFKTYSGKYIDGVLTYDENMALRGPQNVKITKENEVAYYKTVIKNDENGAAMISLFVNSITCDSGNAYVGIYSPEKTYVNSSGTPFCIEDNLIVPNGGTIEVCWYVGASAGATVTFGDLYIVYN